MILRNKIIYDQAIELIQAFSNADIIMPVKINFFLQKNIQIISIAAQEIDAMRLNIAKQFGTYNELNNSYIVAAENMDKVQQELNDLLNIEQDLNIHVFKLDDFDNVQLSYQQLSAIMFMIEE